MDTKNAIVEPAKTLEKLQFKGPNLNLEPLFQ